MTSRNVRSKAYIDAYQEFVNWSGAKLFAGEVLAEAPDLTGAELVERLGQKAAQAKGECARLEHAGKADAL